MISKKFRITPGTVLLTVLFLAGSCRQPATTGRVSIIPLPGQMEVQGGSFTISPNTTIYYSPDDEGLKLLADYLANLFNFPEENTPVVEAYSEGKPQTGNILIMVDSTASGTGREGYTLEIGKKGILLSASALPGIFYGIQSLRQLLPPVAENPTRGVFEAWTVPVVRIIDQPRFSWRGMHLDVSRHFFPIDFIRKYIDYLAMYKYNTFHWHLVDDQGWRIEIRQYPELTRTGAWRVNRGDKPWNQREPQKQGEEATYGGFYTQEEIREIVEYAKQRFVTIVPEIEMPAHVMSALAAYPGLSCTGEKLTVPPGGVWPITDIYCAGKESTFEFMENVLSEVISLFPGSYIHIGGDEATKTNWKKCRHCQERMKEEGLENLEDLQGYFIKRVAGFLHSNNRKLIGWDEILDGGLPPEVTVMSWRGIRGGIEAARLGHDVVMTPTSHCYFDYYQGPRNLEPPAIGGWLPLSMVYSFEPVPPDLSPEESAHILGAQGNVWTEYIPGPGQAEYMLFPRISALAEVLWTGAGKRSWDDYSKRVRDHFTRWDNLNINYAKSSMHVMFRIIPDSLSGTLHTEMSTDLPGMEIRYTTDGSNPGQHSLLYDKPVPIHESLVLKASSVLAQKPVGKANELMVYHHLAFGIKGIFKTAFSGNYSGGGEYALTNGLRGTLDHLDGRWQGYEGNDLVAEFTLDTLTAVSQVSVGFLNKIRSWIFLPVAVILETSDDGLNYTETRIMRGVNDLNNPKVFVRDFQFMFETRNIKYLKIRAINTGTIPEWHEGAGKKAWIFADEIILE